MKKETPYSDLLEHCPNEFDLNNYNLSFLFCSAGIGIDNNLLGRMNDDEYRAVIRTGKILYQYAEDAKKRSRDESGRTGLSEDMFLFRILKELGQEPKTLEEIANPAIQISLDFIKMRELPRKRQEELRSLCGLLSRRASDYWNSQHPHGFKQYAA